VKHALLCLALVACAGSTRHKTLGATLSTLDAAELTLHTFAHAHTEAMIHDATGPQLREDVAAFRTRVDKVETDIHLGYRLAAVAGALDTDPSLATFVAAVKTVTAELVALGAK
jgi:hypothetical protein